MTVRFLPLVAPLMTAVLALSACTQSTTDALELGPADTPSGQASLSGRTPNINVVPRGATAQMTKGEELAARFQLEAAADRNARKSEAIASNAEADYRRQTEALQREGKQHSDRRLKQIEAKAK